jgi:nitroimidazol reductase NimA-like FMN-containing flavoprotein (pyridoxamine 5'-phosphate oxidase superfamily)
MAFGHDGEWLYLHGSAANAGLRAAAGEEVCVTVTVLDALVVGRCPFHSSMNYRSVVVRGRARRVEDPEERLRALAAVSNHIVATWDTGRPPTDRELRQTYVLAVPLTEASAKVRTGGPKDEPEDLDGPHWAGTIPISTVWEAPVGADDLRPGIEVPPAVAALAGTKVHGDPT